MQEDFILITFHDVEPNPEEFNSMGMAMEILTYLKRKGFKVEAASQILPGSATVKVSAND